MKQLSVGCVLLLLAACGSSSGADLSSFAKSYASSYCHFAYHCCTPSDRANPSNPFAVTASAEQTYGFSTEDGCTAFLGAEAGVAFGPYEDSVAAKRMSYDEADGQACLSALASAASACDPNAFLTASQSRGACDVVAFFKGLVPASGECTMSQDCAALNSICAPVDAGMNDGYGSPQVITGAAICVSPPPVGAMCQGECAAGSCCSYFGFSGETCVAYVAEGATCDPACETSPCDPTIDYCDSMGTGACQPLIPNGGACNPLYDGSDCAGASCIPDGGDTSGTCKTYAPVIQICVGNPNGF